MVGIGKLQSFGTLVYQTAQLVELFKPESLFRLSGKYALLRFSDIADEEKSSRSLLWRDDGSGRPNPQPQSKMGKDEIVQYRIDFHLIGQADFGGGGILLQTDEGCFHDERGCQHERCRFICHQRRRY